MNVTVIVLNYNGARFLPDALSSLNSQTIGSFEVLVADNGSSDHSERIALEYGARFLPLGRNFGIAVGNNLAARRARGDFLFFVNNDMRFEAECIESLVEVLGEFPDAFAVDCVQYEWGTREIVHGGTVIRPGIWRSTPIPYIDIDPVGFRDRLAAVPWTCAGNMMVRRSMFFELDGFDHRFFANAEDVDICLRAWMRGWSSIFVPPTRWQNGVEHRVGATLREPNDWRLARTPGNYIRFLLKTGSPSRVALSLASQILDACIRTIGGDIRASGGTMFGVLWNTFLLGDTIKERMVTLDNSKYRLEDILDIFFHANDPLHPQEALRLLSPA